MEKKRRGGKRPHAGAKPMDPSNRRVPLNAMVAPKTKKKIDDTSKEKDISRGVAIDILIGGKNEKDNL